MQTVNFQCGHCGKLMAVGSDFLGQQVRCPHCQQVVVAPLAESRPPSDPEPVSGLVETILHTPPPIADPDDIFSPTEVSDDLFGRSEPPRVEIPPESLAPTLPAEHTAPPGEPGLEPTLATTSLLPPSMASPPANGESTTTLPAGGSEAPWMAATMTETFAPSPAEAPAAPQAEAFTDGAPAAARPQRRKEQGTPWFMILVFSPLLLYAIVITVFAVLLYRHEQDVEQRLRHRFEMMPDDGDNPGVQKGKKTTRIYRYDPKLATQPLPADLCTTLEPDGKVEPIRIGDLQITPLRVKRERVKVITDTFADKPEPRAADSLVLYLNMKNLSSEYTFAPLDNYFDRYWREGQDQLPPLTQLEVGGGYRFYGGPAHWYPRDDRANRREWVVGRMGFEADLLEPGEEREFFVCTDGGNARGVLALFGESDGEQVRPAYHGSLLWRIRVRRGPVQIDDKQYSATAVVGVKFTDKAIQ
jgi:phage FluMu protein Com